MQTHYTLKAHALRKSLLEVTIRLQDLEDEAIELHLPMWRPGRYFPENYAKFMKSVRAFAGQEECAVKKTSAHAWQINTRGAKEIEVRYLFFAHYPTAGGSVLKHDLFYLNFINCILYPKGKLEAGLGLKLELPAGFQSACALPIVSGETLMVSSFYRLFDCPILASPSLKTLETKAYDLPVYFHYTGKPHLDTQKLEHDLKAIAECQIDTFGGIPIDSYRFLCLFEPKRRYHGVEHTDSTVLQFGPEQEVGERAQYCELIGVISHELFHVWNAKTFYPKELHQPRFTEAAYFRTGHVIEGLTTYMGDLLAFRAGVFSLPEYEKEIGAVLSRFFNMAMGNSQSLPESSVDLWLDGYEQGTPGKKLSIYNEGSLYAFLLDLMIRQESQNSQDLGQLLQALYQESQSPAYQGYTEESYTQLLQSFLPRKHIRYLTEVLYKEGGPDLDFVNLVLGHIGFKLSAKRNPDPIEAELGIKLESKEGRLVVKTLHPRSPVAPYLEKGDTIVEIDGMKPVDWQGSDGKPLVHLKADWGDVETDRTLEANGFFCSFSLEQDNDPSLLENRNHWLNGTNA